MITGTQEPQIGYSHWGYKLYVTLRCYTKAFCNFSKLDLCSTCNIYGFSVIAFSFKVQPLRVGGKQKVLKQAKKEQGQLGGGGGGELSSSVPQPHSVSLCSPPLSESLEQGTVTSVMSSLFD